MRPLCLEMTAFGSYAETTVLPFEDLRHDLYLVTGDTGAGKTTIFDAIMFALFGVPSGEDRKWDMLHCDHVPKSTDTVVSLRFSQGGKEYTVTRRLHFGKRRGTTDRYNDGALSAVLTEPDRAPTEGSNRVSSRCEEILGLNSEQFRNIVMLAQGEFRKFLKSDSDEKNEILGNLFDNAEYVYYQDLLIGARDALKQRRGTDEEQLRTLMLSVFVPPVRSDEVSEEYLPEHPALVENLERLTENEKIHLEQKKRERDEIRRKIETLHTQKGAAETMNGLLAELESERGRLAGLEALDPEMAARQKVYDRAETAFHKAAPALEAYARANAQTESDAREIERLSEELEGYERLVESAQAEVEADAGAEKKRDDLKVRIDAIESQLPRYRELAGKLAEKKSAKEAAAQASSAREEEEKNRDRIAGEILVLQKKLEELDRVDVEVQKSEYEKQRAEEDMETLVGENGVRKEVFRIRQSELENRKAKERLLSLTEEAGRAAAEYSRLYQHFIAGQAGLLADDLRTELETKEEASCPVCRTKLCAAHLPQLAVRPDDTPDQKTVDEAKRAADQIDAERQRKYTDVEKTAAALELKKQAALERARTILEDCEDWDRLNDESYLTGAVEKLSVILEDRRAALAHARSRQEERELCRRQLAEKELDHRTSGERTQTLREEARKQETAALEAESAMREIKKQLFHEDEAAAAAEKKALEGEKEALSRLLLAHRTALDNARKERDNCQGSLTEKSAAAEKHASERNEALTEMERVLILTGFDSAEDVALALAPIGKSDGDTWLKSELAALAGHEYAKQHARETIEKLKERTEGSQFTDLSELEQQLDETSGESEKAESSYSEQEALMKNHCSVLAQVRQIKAHLASSDSAWKRLETLADLAGGVSGEGGKLSFDRYVMGAVFREVLEMANRRMELMSGGRYELVHKTSADRRNAKAGLDIEVLDNITGVQRPSGSLSGGESFFTSLALALGLSDVVQNHAGGKRMDALFIDEGFGTLSTDVLDKALEVLDQLTDGDRLVGIISHVDKLDESIPQKIRVKNGERGSSLVMELT